MYLIERDDKQNENLLFIVERNSMEIVELSENALKYFFIYCLYCNFYIGNFINTKSNFLLGTKRPLNENTGDFGNFEAAFMWVMHDFIFSRT